MKNRTRTARPEATAAADWTRLTAAAVFAVALLVRLPAVLQSLWYDEMYTLLNYVLAPWGHIVAGDYSPNNHVLYSLLAKAMSLAVAANTFDLTVAIRLPSLLAGSAAAVAIAWPLRRQLPLLALAIALTAALNPWLVSLSGWARGYALLLLLSAVATHLLPQQHRPFHWAYAAAMVAALYTQPIALGIVIGHGACMLIERRRLFVSWLISTAIAGAVVGMLYTVFLATGAREYWAGGGAPSVPYGQFLRELLPQVHLGQSAVHAAFLVPPLLILVAGGALAWTVATLRPMLITFAVATLCAILLPVAIPRTGEVRAALWLIPLYCIGAGALLLVPRPMPYLRWAGAATLLIFLAMRVYAIDTVPAQPIAEAVTRAREIAGEGGTVIGVYTASVEARALYRGIDAVAYDLPTLRQVERNASAPVIAVVFYEQLLGRNPEARPLWDYLNAEYQAVSRLAGRVAPAAIYRRAP